MLDALVRGLPGGGPPGRPGQVGEFIDRDVRNRLLVRTAVLVHTIPVDETTAPQWARIAVRAAADRSGPRAPTEAATLSPNIRAMWEALPWWEGNGARGGIAGSPVPTSPGGRPGATNGG